ncbi:MAG: hypothetical protein WCL00_13395 [Bacteroidota bacterium]
MLVNFYNILNQDSIPIDNPDDALTNKKIIFKIELNPKHPVYEGHFPGNPVVPGVCQVQIIRELVSDSLGKEVELFTSDFVKFMNMIVPGKTPQLEVKLEIKEIGLEQWSVNATIYTEEYQFIKFRGKFQPMGTEIVNHG